MAMRRGVRLGTMIKQRGFTLIEMAAVLVIIGLVVGGGVVAIGPIIQQSKLNQTNVAMDQVEAALVLFAMRNNRLPCPADGSLTSSATTYGQETTQGGTGGNTTNNCAGTGSYAAKN